VNLYSLPCAFSVTMTKAVKAKPKARKRKKSVYKPENNKHLCEFEGCGKLWPTPSALTIHMRKHTKERPFLCTYDGCGKGCTTKDSLQVHTRTHTKETPFSCDVEGCGKSFKTSGQLNGHKLVHSGLKPHKCPTDGCDKRFSDPTNLKRHMVIHTDVKDYICTVCEKRFNHPSNLQTHMGTHDDVKRFRCDFEGCTHACAQFANLVTHKRTHTGHRPFKCKVEHCDAAFKQGTDLKKHHVAWHTVDGMKKRKRQEDRVRMVLKEVYTVNEEIYVKYADRVPKPDRYFARVDFGLPSISKACVIVECDEKAHKFYEVACELSRMEQVSESMIQGGETRPLVFIRYNPDGKYEMDGVDTGLIRKVREAGLLRTLAAIESGEMAFSSPLNIVYLYYSTNNGVPTVCEDSDFHPQMKGCVYGI
jgi:hypothetical protein